MRSSTRQDQLVGFLDRLAVGVQDAGRAAPSSPGSLLAEAGVAGVRVAEGASRMRAA